MKALSIRQPKFVSKMPSSEDLRLAVLWLEQNEGDEAERAPLSRVARWLDGQADSQELREIAKQAGVSASQLRAAIKRKDISLKKGVS